MKRYGAESFGTFWLVLGGCGSAVLAAAFPNVGIGLLGVSLAFVIFMVIKAMNSMKKQEPAPVAAPTTKTCPECSMAIPIAAKRCGYCTRAVK